ncbi:unnamed protein product [Sphagnum jensenii]|uniref:Uncharacterized protein n=1 Tax=Sphagnum jensenii TaxID=128206 RepID=A0ABP1A4U1_9BRYO
MERKLEREIFFESVGQAMKVAKKEWQGTEYKRERIGGGLREGDFKGSTEMVRVVETGRTSSVVVLDNGGEFCKAGLTRGSTGAYNSDAQFPGTRRNSLTNFENVMRFAE